MFDTDNLKAGALSGLAAGGVLGLTMGSFKGMLLMIAEMAGHPGAAVILAARLPVLGLLVHMGVSALVGVSFAALFGRRIGSRSGSVSLAFLYSLAWWLLVPVTAVPWILGDGPTVPWSASVMVPLMPSLAGHLIYGAALGITYGLWRTVAPLPLRSPANR